MGRVIAMRSEKGEKAGKGGERAPEAGHRRREAAGIVVLALALFLVFSIGSLAIGDGKLMGPVGLWVATAIYSLVGVGAGICAYGLLVLAARCLRAAPLRVRVLGAGGFLGAGLSTAVLLHLVLGNYRLHGMPPGGAVGEYGAEMSKAMVGTAGTALVAVAGLLLSLLASTAVSFRAAFEQVGRVGQGTLGLLGAGVRSIFPGDDDEEEEEEAERAEKEERDAKEGQKKRRAREAAVEGVPIVPADALPAKAPVIQRRETGLPAKDAAKDVPEAAGKESKDGKDADRTIVAPAGEPAATAAHTEPVIALRTDSATRLKDKDKETQPPPVVVMPQDEGRQRRKRAAAGVAPAAAGVAPAVATVAPAVAPAVATVAPAAAAAAIAPAAAAAAQATSDRDESEEEDEEEGQGDPLRGSPTVLDIGDAPNPRDARRTATLIDPVEEAGEAEIEEEEDDDEAEEPEAPVVVPPAPASAQKAAAPAPPVIEAARPSKPPPPKVEYIKLAGDYQLPSIDLLDYKEQGQGDLDRQAMLDLAQRLEKTLLDYQVKGRVSEIHPGPVVTMYEFVPAPGIKLSKITALSNDLAMALEALRVRIVAPIPGKAAVGIEVPNRGRETVYLKEILADDCFTKAKSKVTLALGKDIAGNPVCVDLSKMPHLLVAGTTGSGKSVSVNGMVSSILFNASPDDVKMIMIDPKMLELSIYEGIPHLLLPVVTDPKKANLALKWAVDEMERRYDLISKSGVRDIGGYNKKVEKALEERPRQLSLQPRTITIEVEGADGQPHEVQVAPSEEAVRAAGGVVTDEIRAEISDAVAENEAMKERQAAEDLPRKLPYIVVLIDEFADLMMVASKEVETSVARIAQKARAAGIHLILATQRPSVDVITGLIKANFPSRIAFQVASRIDSRTILDAQGAENLLGMGDMLFTDRGQALRRVHGALITDGEIHRLVEHLKKQGQPIYDMEILKPRTDDEGEPEEEDMSDEMYDLAVRLVVESRQASISMVQRKLRIGYNRAARMIERMEREGLVSAADGAKGREVLVNSLPD